MRWLLLLALAACDAPSVGLPQYDDGGTPYCWIYTCPSDPDASMCGTCKDPEHDLECPPGFVCSCFGQCLKGPRTYDGGLCIPLDAGLDSSPDAMLYDWPVCDQQHQPGDTL